MSVFITEFSTYMPTELYAQWPNCPESKDNTRLMYFRFPLSKEFFEQADSSELEFSDGMSFNVYIVVNDAAGKSVHIPLGRTVSSKDIPQQNGSQPNLHPDQVFFRINSSFLANTMSKVYAGLQSGKYRDIARVEIHSSLSPCTRKHGCKEFLLNNILKILDPDRLGLINLRDIWVISYRYESNDYNLVTRQYDKKRKDRALTANAARLQNSGAPLNHDPESGTIRCIKRELSGQYVCKTSTVVYDYLDGSKSPYGELLVYQQKLLLARNAGERGPKLPDNLQRLQVSKLEQHGAHSMTINAARRKLTRTT